MLAAFRFFVLLAFTSALCAQETNALLTNAVDILALPGERAFGRSVLLRGVVTAAQPDWEKRFFVQDSTSGVFVEASSPPQPEPGDFVEITGTTSPGGYAPFVTWAAWKKLGTAPLPPAKRAPIEQLMAGMEDSQRVEVAGVVRAYRVDQSTLVYEVVSGGYRLNVHVPPALEVDPRALTGARVRIRGTAGTLFSGQLRQLITVELNVPFPSDFIVERAEESNPFDSPVLLLNNLAQYRRDRQLGERVHVKGTLTFQRVGEDIFLQDATCGIQVRSHQPINLTRGDVVEAVGFLDFEHFLPVLNDAVFRKTGEPRELVEANPVSIRELQAGYRHADLIQLGGKVLERTVARLNQQDGSQLGQKTILTLQNQGIVFTVEAVDGEPDAALARVPLGSTVDLKGICLMQIAGDGKMRSVQMLLPTAGDIRILQRPSWLTPARLRLGLMVLSGVLLVALGWVAMVHKKNAALKQVIAEKVKAQHELQESHSLLEWRVAERTKQLKVEMTARKEAEVQFKATIAERTRLAQELHDTVEQTLTGIGFQLDTAAILIPENPAAGNHHVELARNLMTQSQLELRRSVWDLRSRELEQFDFPQALRTNAQQFADGSRLKLELEVKGPVRPIPEVAEDNLLRICQEALANVGKHARASEAKVFLEFLEAEVLLQIADNGQGFNPAKAPGSVEGHFGLLGMAERAKRLGGEFALSSAPGSGTRVEVRIPIAPAAEELEPA